MAKATNCMNDSQQPLVSVIIPTYNRSAELLRAIDSVQNQTYSNLEIIVVDDASTDGTQQKLEQLNDARLRVFRHSTNLFAAAARNTGMQQAKGQWIAFLDSDDTWYAQKLEKQVARFQQEPDCGFQMAGIVMKQGRGYREKILLPNLQPDRDWRLLWRFMTGHVHIVTTTFMFRRELLEQVGLMDVQLRRNQDLDFFIRMIDTARGTSIEEPLAEVFPNTNPPSLDIVEQSNKRLLDKHRERFGRLGRFQASSIQAVYRFSHGKRHIQRGSFWSGMRWMARGICTNPFINPRHYLSAAYWMLRRLAGTRSSK